VSPMKRRNHLPSMIAMPLAALCLLLAATGMAEDWPTYRHDNARSAVTPEDLDLPLAAQWIFVPPHPPAPAWTNPAKEKARVRFDEAYHVAAAGDAVYFGSSADGTIYCLDAVTGQLRWSTITGGPVRVAPTIWNGAVYVGSDDGHAYCLDARNGRVNWKVRGAYGQNQVLGNGYMISLWPIRTGVMVENGIAYFGAGVFPHETLFLCAVNAEDGSLLWRNDTYGETGYKLEFGGVSPQGPLLASEDTLFVPSGRAMPAAFNKSDGTFMSYLPPGGKIGGTWALLTEDRLIAGVESKRAYSPKGHPVRNTAYAWFPGVQLVVEGDYAYMVTFEELAALDRKAFSFAEEWRANLDKERKPLVDRLNILESKARRLAGDKLEAVRAELGLVKRQLADMSEEQEHIEAAVRRWEHPWKHHHALMLAGDLLFAGGDNTVAAVLKKTGQELWSGSVDGKACGLAAANGRLLVSTDTGQIVCFASGEASAPTHKLPTTDQPFPDDALTTLCARFADQVVAATGVTKGFCLVYGSGTGRLAYELAQRTELHIVGIEPDMEQAEAARKALGATGLYGARLRIDQGDLAQLPYADYFANLIVSEAMLTTDAPLGSQDELMRVLKPCGGVLYLARPEQAVGADASWDSLLTPSNDFNGIPEEDNLLPFKTVRGALPGAGQWTHQYADPGNTACSDDELVRGPLGVLWFGRPGPEQMVERHARSVAPVAMDGRLFVQGENLVMAYDAYNGVQLWERALPGAVRVRVDSDMGNLALRKDGLYVATDDTCVRLDPATGELLREYRMPPAPNGQTRRWGYIACVGDTLFGSTAHPLREDYGLLWDEIAGEDGQWVDVEAAAQKRQEAYPQRYIDAINRFQQEFSAPNEQAFWRAQQSGFMWHTMSPFPAWGSVDTPVGAVTERIMDSDVFFALDTESGEVQWTYPGKAIAHPAITIGDGTVFLADCSITAEQKKAAMQERQALIAQGVWEKEEISYGPEDADIRQVVALEATTGAKQWERIIDLTGCGGDRMGMAYRDGVLCFFGCFSNHDRELFTSGRLKWRRVTALAAKDGRDLWSRPLNYLRRPVIVGDEILVEPRACSLHTGAVKNRMHPLTGADSEWEFVRPGHCCSITSASPNMFFLRGYFLWYYDLERDQGMLPFGAIRPGCWINTIPANGLVLFPEASSGCTCSYPVRSTVVLQPKERLKTWALCVQNGPMTPVQRMAINFGAPGDWRDEDGTMWFSYPHPPSSRWYDYGVKFRLQEKFVGERSFFCRNQAGIAIEGTDKPWIFTSGCKGLSQCVAPLLDAGQGSGRYTVRLYFAETQDAARGQRVFTVKLQGEPVLKNFDIVKEAGGVNKALTKEFTGIQVKEGLQIDFECAKKDAGPLETPIINGIEMIREDVTVAKAL